MARKPKPKPMPPYDPSGESAQTRALLDACRRLGLPASPSRKKRR